MSDSLPCIVPLPRSMHLGGAPFRFGAATPISGDPDVSEVVGYLREALAARKISSVESASERSEVTLRLDPDLGFGPEGYRLSAGPGGIRLSAEHPRGLFYGVQTLLQLLSEDDTIPGVEIEDSPRFGWRGALVDVGRHFLPLADLKRFIDGLARYKFNVLHLHLTEDQGWRVEIHKYPRLTEVGSIRKETMAGPHDDHRFDGTPHGGFYRQEELRELVAYAAARFITIMPEIELPGHSQAAIAAYPELGCTGEQLEVATSWGVSENIYNVSDATLGFLEDVLEEVLAIFPSSFIHIGGDEAPKKQWQSDPKAQARIAELGLADEDALQSWFIAHFERFLSEKGRRLVGWDEILEGGLPSGATVMSWRGEEGGISAARSGHDVIMSPSEYVYLDHYQSQNRDQEPLAIGGCSTLRTVYEYEPVPAGLSAEEARHVLGSQGQLWTEYIPNSAQLEYMAFPRLCALAEVLWLPANQKDFTSFWARLENELPRLAALGIRYRPLDPEQADLAPRP